MHSCSPPPLLTPPPPPTPNLQFGTRSVFQEIWKIWPSTYSHAYGQNYTNIILVLLLLHTATHTHTHTCAHTHAYTHTHILPCSCCHCSSTISCLGFWRRPHSALLQEYPCGTVQTQRCTGYTSLLWLAHGPLYIVLYTQTLWVGVGGGITKRAIGSTHWRDFIVRLTSSVHPSPQCLSITHLHSVCKSPIPTMCVY